MKISQSDWIRYREMMSKIGRKAAEEFDARFRGRINTVERKEVIDYAMALVEKYSEATSELACQMYERIAALSGVDIPPAVPAEAAEYGEVAKGINGTLKQSPEGKLCSDVVDRLVKRAGADTMLKNAERDRAQFAWVPHGDTCSFCIILASRGWQNISKKTLKNGHAEHIHAHCDCQYCVRFNQNTEVEGYDPDQYLEQYRNASEGNWKDKLNAMRKEHYDEYKDVINAQKRKLYAIREDTLETFRKVKNTGVFAKYKELMSKRHVRGIVSQMGLDPGDVKYTIDRNTEMIGTGYFGHTSDDGRVITLYPDAFADREELVKTIGHENTHLQQVRKDGNVKSIEELQHLEVVGSFLPRLVRPLSQ